MRTRIFWVALITILTGIGERPASAFQTSLILIGGGKRPPLALQHFVQATHGRAIWVFPWGTESPRESFESIKSELNSVGAADVRWASERVLSTHTRLQLEQAGGFYFPGGDQNQIMDRLVRENLTPLFRRKYLDGVAVAGTSAGTAIQTDPMLTGNGSETSQGLGLLPNYLVDQHFWVRKRETRLLAALLRLHATEAAPVRGLGIDEDNAIEFQNGQPVEVFGPSRVSFYDWEPISQSYRRRDVLAGDSIPDSRPVLSKVTVDLVHQSN